MTNVIRSGVELITDERKKQVDEKHWTAQHDDHYMEGELALAAACYAAPIPLYRLDASQLSYEFCDPWPWFEDSPYQRKTPVFGHYNHKKAIERRIVELTKAGALIAAEIDRLQRMANNQNEQLEPL